MMFSVRIDKDGDGYMFKVQPIEPGLEMVALDSTPGIIAMVQAATPGIACQRAWFMAMKMNSKNPEQLNAGSDNDYLESLLKVPT